MKSFVLMSFIFWCVGAVQMATAQGIERDNFLVVGVGVPVSDYGSSDINNDEASFVLPGVSLAGATDFWIGEQAGIRIVSSAHLNGTDVDAIVEEAALLDPTLDWEVSSSGTIEFNGGVGAVGRTPFGRGTIKGFIAGGIGVINLPEQSVSASDGTTFVTITAEALTSFGFAWQSGIEFHSPIRNGRDFILGLSYSAAYYSGERNERTVVNGSLVESTAFTSEVTTTMIHLRVGISL